MAICPVRNRCGSATIPIQPSTFSLGLIDEVSIYNRALAAGEIVAIYNSNAAGKCPLPPTFVQAPQSRTSFAGNHHLHCRGKRHPPLAYQWQLNGTNIAGATNATLTLTNLQFSQQETMLSLSATR